MNILVLGGNGFIGRHFVDHLIDTPNKILIVDKHHRDDLNGIEQVMQLVGNYQDSELLDEALKEIDIVAHLVSTTVPATAQKDFIYDIESNLIGTIRLVKSMLKHDIKRIVYLSSGGTVYGIPRSIPVDEQHALHPVNAYGITKTAIEHCLGMYKNNQGLKPVILRISNPYGEGKVNTGVQGVIGNFMEAIRNNEPLNVFGNGSVVRDYIYAGDVAQAMVLALDSAACTYNIGTGTGKSIQDVIQTLQIVTNRKLEIVYKQGNPHDIPSIVLNTELASHKLGWQAKVSFEEGVDRTWKWFQSCQ